MNGVSLKKRLKDLDQQRDRLVQAVADGTMVKEDIKKSMDKIRESEESARTRIGAIDYELGGIPGADKIEKLNRFKGRIVRSFSKDYPKWILDKSYDYQKNLLRTAFAGKDPQGKRFGVYVLYNEKTKKFDFELRGILGTELMSTPMDTWTIAQLFHLDSDYQDVEVEAERIRESITKDTRH